MSSKTETQMANKHLETGWASLRIREIETKGTKNQPFIPITSVKMTRSDNAEC